MDTDAAIYLDKNYHIQVGHNYLSFDKEEGTQMDFSITEIAEAKNIKDLIPKIKKEMHLK